MKLLKDNNLFIKIFFVITTIIFSPYKLLAWQQRVSYKMNITLDAIDHRYTGYQRLVYYNNSPDTLKTVYYHLFYNAFQKGSMMDIHDNSLPMGLRGTANRRRLQFDSLDNDDAGLVRVDSLFQNGKPMKYFIDETILQAELETPILPNDSTIFEMRWITVIPKLTRRGGWMSSEGVEFSMAQWYPKLAAYDNNGWHNDPYVGKEFYGVFGDYDVTLTVASDLIVGATGKLQNPEEVKCGYEFLNLDTTVTPRNNAGGMKTWHFKAEKVHDFAWVADREYIHQITHESGTVIHLLYKKNAKPFWASAANWTKQILNYFNNLLGKYEYPQFTVAMAGDGGMEYPQLIMITGFRGPRSLASVLAHEIGHQWFYGMLGNNETQEAWLDEGFTNFINNEAMRNCLFKEKPSNPFVGLDKIVYHWRNEQWEEVTGYYQLATSGYDEPLCTYHDHFRTAANAGLVYSKGDLILKQLRYFLGTDRFYAGLKHYVQKWKFHSPSYRDFEFAMEQSSGAKLDDFLNDWVNTTKKCDYAIQEISSENSLRGFNTKLQLKNKGEISMPLDILLTYEDGSTALALVPTSNYIKPGAYIILPQWKWVSKTYETVFFTPKKVIKAEIDTSLMLADIDRTDNAATVSFVPNFMTNLHTGFYKRFDLNRPINAYSIRLRPTLWYSEFDAFQFGFLADGGYIFNRYNSKFGIYWNSKSKRIDYDLQYSLPLNSLVNDSKANFVFTNNDGLQNWSCGVEKIFRDNIYSSKWHKTYIQAVRNYNLITKSDDVNYFKLGYNKFSRQGNSDFFIDANSYIGFMSYNFVQLNLMANANYAINSFSLKPALFLGFTKGEIPNLLKYNIANARNLELHNNVVHRLAMNSKPDFMRTLGLMLPNGMGAIPSLAQDNELLDNNLISLSLRFENVLQGVNFLKNNFFDVGAYTGLGYLFAEFGKLKPIIDLNFELGATVYCSPMNLLPQALKDAIASPNEVKLAVWFPFITYTNFPTSNTKLRFSTSVSF